MITLNNHVSTVQTTRRQREGNYFKKQTWGTQKTKNVERVPMTMAVHDDNYKIKQ
jgi:hypothetical protein